MSANRSRAAEVGQRQRGGSGGSAAAAAAARPRLEKSFN